MQQGDEREERSEGPTGEDGVAAALGVLVQLWLLERVVARLAGEGDHDEEASGRGRGGSMQRGRGELAAEFLSGKSMAEIELGLLQ